MTAPFDRLKTALGDRYDLERPIGEGGMATVYLARDLKHERRVAIKVLRPELSVSLGADRFLREIRVAANLQHPNILGLYDSGELDGLLYYVMPFVEGESLRDRLNREQQLPIHDAIQITREAAEALDYAHKHGIVHRDIKPENILIQGGHALVADFGIARAFSQAGGEKLTQTGMAVGTPAYMSPEQSHGSDHVDARSDVYSLGCVLYELLIGQPPFTGPNAMAIMARHAMEVVPSLQVVRQSVPDDVEDAVMRALEKTPADRFQTMAEFCERLSEAQAESTMARTAARRAATGAARRVGTREIAAAQVSEPPSPPPRKRLALIAAAAVALLLVGAGALAALRWNRASTGAGSESDLDPRRIAVLYFTGEPASDSMDYLASGLTEGLIDELDRVPQLDVVSKGGVGPFRKQDIARDSIARALKAGTLVLGDVEREGSKTRATIRLVDGGSGADFERASFELPTGDPREAQRALAERATDLIRARLGEEIRLREQRGGTRSPDAWAAVQQANRHQEEGSTAAERGDSAAELQEFAAADSLFTRAERSDPEWVSPLVGRATLAYRRSRLASEDPIEAGRLIAQGLEQAQRALALDGQNADGLEVRGNLRYWKWLLNLETDPSAARSLLASARADLEAAVKINPEQAGAWASLSHLYYQTSNQVDVKLAARRAYEADAYLSNANVVLARLFYASYDLGQFPDAVQYCAEGQRRFPQDYRFVECQLYLLTTKAKEPDPALAWRLADSLSALVPSGEREFQKLNARMMIAATLARAGLADSARRVAASARGNSELDPTRDLVYADAFVQTLLGDTAAAIASLRTYLAANPERRANFAEETSWWFRPLEGNSAYRTLVGNNR